MANDSRMLTKSRNAADDEFYTLYEDIAAELPNYKEQLKGASVLCPCDWDEALDATCVYASKEYVQGSDLFSGGEIKVIDTDKTDAGTVMRDIRAVKCNFVKFLIAHAEDYGIESISVSGYNPETGEGVKFEDIDYSRFTHVITNPPFSKWRSAAKIWVEDNPHLKFLIIGPQNAITYQDCFQYIHDNKMWLGYHYHLNGFTKPDGTVIGKQDNLARSCCWFTNMDVSYRHDEMILTEEYDPERNPTYANYDAIEVGKTKDIPYDYEGEMGVPITFLQKYNPEQFELIGNSITLARPMREIAEKGEYEQGGNRFYHNILSKSDIAKGYKYHRGFDRLVVRNRKPVKKNEE